MLASSHLFQGIKFNFTRTLFADGRFSCNHAVNLGEAPPPGSPPGSGTVSNYHFAPQWLSRAGFPNEPKLVLRGDLDTEGDLRASINSQLTPKALLRINGGTNKDKWGFGQGELIYDGSDFTVGLVGANINPAKGSGIYIANYHQRVAKHWSLGGEFMVQSDGTAMMPALGMGVGFGESKSKGDSRDSNGAISATFGGQPQVIASYFESIAEGGEESKHQLGTKFTLGGPDGSVNTALGWAYASSAGTTIRGSVDSDGVISSVIEHQLLPKVLPLSLAARLDQSKKGDNLDLGIGLTIAQ